MSVLLLVRCDCFITYQQSACALEQGRSNEVDPAMLQVPQDWEPKCRRIRVETGAWYPPDESRFGDVAAVCCWSWNHVMYLCHVICHHCVGVGVCPYSRLNVGSFLHRSNTWAGGESLSLVQ